MRILIVPKNEVSFYKIFSNKFFFPNIFNPVWRNYLTFKKPTYEYNYLSDLNLNNKNEIFILGKIHKSYLSTVKSYSTNPTGHNCPKVINITLDYINKNLTSFDIVIFSNLSCQNKELVNLRRKFIENRTLVCILEQSDIDYIENVETDSEITNDLIPNKDFHIYFKKDIPLKIKRPWLFPLAPDPIRLKSFNINLKPMSKKKTTVYFSGIVDKEITSKHRKILLEHFKNIAGSKIKVIDLDIHYSKEIFSNFKLEKEMSDSKFILSPPGRSWTTTRHVNLSCYNCIPIVCEPDIQTVNLKIIDGENCIKYKNLKNLKNDEKIFEIEKLIEKLNNFLELPNDQLEKIAENWREHVFENHTVEKKSEYILNTIKNYRKEINI